MCGRYTLFCTDDELADGFSIIRQGPDQIYRPSYNVAPTQRMPIVVRDAAARVVRLARFGLIPSWAKDPAIGSRMINARAETVREKPAFRSAFKARRALIPTTGFIEWRPDGRAKTPLLIRVHDRRVFAFAGLWELWRDADGEPVHSFTIVTTTPNRLVATIHDRMPVVLDPGDYDAWLNGEPDDAAALMHPYRDGALEAYAVSTLVNKPANNRPECVEPVDGEIFT